MAVAGKAFQTAGQINFATEHRVTAVPNDGLSSRSHQTNSGHASIDSGAEKENRERWMRSQTGSNALRVFSRALLVFGLAFPVEFVNRALRLNGGCDTRHRMLRIRSW